jgi:hypothetical protein
MGFKIDASFLRFLKMGAVGVRATMESLRAEGFNPIELERYSTSSKIWATKVKRLRLPDVVCVRTGLRVEVRAKSELKIRMSDAPTNPTRRWDIGLRDDDFVSFVPCSSEEEGVIVSDKPVFFSVGELRASVRASKLGPPKSASEGAERDREWPSTVPSQDGVVIELTRQKIISQLSSGRRQTYQLQNKRPYVSVGDRFAGKTSIIAGVVPRLAPLSEARQRTWDPVRTLGAPDAVDRYAAAKAIPHQEGLPNRALSAILRRMREEPDERVALELAASAARLGDEAGFRHVVSTVWEHEHSGLRMEAVLILSELGNAAASVELMRIASAAEFAGDELRQAAAWGLGRAGCRSYDQLVRLLGDDDDAVVLHAIAAFGPDTPTDVITSLVHMLEQGSLRQRAAASEALRLIGSDEVLRALITAARRNDASSVWILTTLGRMPAAKVRSALAGDPLLERVEPLLTLLPSENWLTTPANRAYLGFLLMQA